MEITTDVPGPLRRAVGLFVPRPSALRRSSDRLELAARWVVLLVALAILPAALAVGSEVTAGLALRGEHERAERHLVTAVVLAEPEGGTGLRPDIARGLTRVPVGWTAGDGSERRAVVDAPSTATAGDPHGVWVDRGDRPVRAPMDPAAPAGMGFLAVFLLVLGDLVVSLVLLAGLRWVLDRRRLRQWEAAWRRFTEPGTALR